MLLPAFVVKYREATPMDRDKAESYNGQNLDQNKKLVNYFLNKI